MKKVSRLVLVVLLAGFVLPLATPHRAQACSGGGWDVGYRERISELYAAEYVTAVTLAEITSLQVIAPPNGAFIPIGSAGTIASFRPQVLWANAALRGNTIGRLGTLGADCSGGPLVQPGDKVLLFLRTSRYPIADFSISAFGETVLFRGESAFFLNWTGEMEPAGSTEEVLSLLLSVAKSPETTTGPAREFLGLPSAN